MNRRTVFRFTLKDIEEEAKENIKDEKIKEFIYGGADANEGVERNRKVLKETLLLPKICSGLKEKSQRSTETTILGKKVSMPIGFAPVTARTWVNKDGEIVTANVASAEKIPFSLSCWSPVHLEKVSEALKSGEDTLKLFQMTIWKEEEQALEIIKRVEAAEYDAIIIQLDHGANGNRRADSGTPMKSAIMKYVGLPNVPKQLFKQYTSGQFVDASVFEGNGQTWDDIKWLKKNTSLPIVAKGIATVSDAQEAIKAGVDAIWVSNDGGRQLADAPAALTMLKRISKAVKGSKVELYVDGGFRSGGDVVKALAMGARAVFIGRPNLSALALEGEDGVKSLVQILRGEFANTMGQCGFSTVDEIDESVLWTEE